MRGQAADGRAYRARDPELMLWVQATLVLTSVRWYEAVLGRMSETDRDAYWAEGKFFAGELGVPKELFPATYADLERYEAKMLETVVVPDETAKAVARDVLRPTAGSLTSRYGRPTRLPPRCCRFLFAAPSVSPLVSRSACSIGAVIVAIRAMRPLLPEWITVVPQARRFERALSESREAA